MIHLKKGVIFIQGWILTVVSYKLKDQVFQVCLFPPQLSHKGML